MFKTILCTLLATSFMVQNGLAQRTDSIAENMLVYQRSSGGWAKQFGLSLWPVDYKRHLSQERREIIREDQVHYEATIDNDATTPEIRYLVKAFTETGNKAYLQSAEKGIAYLLKAQYPNGGWPQFYPLKKGYYTHITYNDDAMIHAMSLLQDVATDAAGFDVVDRSFVPRAKEAVKKGIECILNTQVKVNGKLTVWCAQHDEHTLLPAPARAFELVSLSGLESVPLVSFLIRIPNPSPEIKRCITSAVEWFNNSKILGYNFIIVKDSTQPSKSIDAVLVPDPSSTLWARFYDIDTNTPIFVGKDGIARRSVAEIENERRVGYSWYGRWPEKLINKEYPEWLKKNGAGPSASAHGPQAIPVVTATTAPAGETEKDIAGEAPMHNAGGTPMHNIAETVTDIDGNVYPISKIGSQEWMGANLKVTKYSNGEPIPSVTDDDQWSDLTTGAWSVYRNIPSFDNPYGKLYNWYAVTDSRGICPKGWHMATDKDWDKLSNELGGKTAAGSIKVLGIWDPPNGGAANSNGFAALGGGLRNFYGMFKTLGTFGYYWTSTPANRGTAWFRKLDTYDAKLGRDDAMKETGFSCRCVKD
jgi:PelA/Pel-15E family pectate lyase